MAEEFDDLMSDAAIRASLMARRDRLREQLEKVEQAISAFENPVRRHKMDTVARKNIAEAQKKRWANWRREHKKPDH